MLIEAAGRSDPCLAIKARGWIEKSHAAGFGVQVSCEEGQERLERDAMVHGLKAGLGLSPATARLRNASAFKCPY